MEDEKKLYPLRMCPIRDEYSWGSEEFKLADLGYRDSMVAEGWLGGSTIGEIMDMYLDRVVGEDVFDYYGRQFPFQVKYIHVQSKMPLRVHPDDETAGQRYDFLGKDKLWYVVKAGRDARLMLGFKKDTDASEVYGKCLDSSIGDILNVVAPIEGQSYRIAPGTPHAASGEMLIAEVSQSSPLDFCMCGWGVPVSTEEFDGSLNLVDALDFINYKKYVAEDGVQPFVANHLELHDPLRISSETSDAAVCYVCLKGEASLQTEMEGGLGPAVYTLKEGQTVLVPAELQDFILAPLSRGTELLEVMASKEHKADSYINPDVPAQAEEDQE